MAQWSHSRRTQFWIGAGLYSYLGLTLFLPVIVIALWAFYDPAVGWFPPDIIPRVLLGFGLARGAVGPADPAFGAAEPLRFDRRHGR